MATRKSRKKQRLRNNEYYDTQAIYDELYSKAKENRRFTNLYDLIVSRENILLAYRNIKKNKGSKTKGVNATTILDIGKDNPERLISYVRNRMSNFQPMPVRRVEIPKDNGKVRPLGIPTMEDRLIQQCIKQVLEPICEAKFYKHSYGFRPNRSTHHAIARVLALTNRHNFQYVVDIDIKGFFDNVNHGKLMKQLWSLGIQDKQLLCVISKMLKTEIKGIGVPQKGVPQGGILSPLLSNVVLNELDWWIASQWENHKTHHSYKDPTRKYELLRKGNLKEVFIVRYADDFKLFCKDRKTAEKMYAATKQWLEERLGLEISPEKSKIVNLRKRYSEFLGFKLKLWKKGQKYVVKSHMTEKSKEKCKKELKQKIKVLQHDASLTKAQQELVAQNLPVVHWVICDYIHVNSTICGLEYSDLFQEGCLWLCKAAATYKDDGRAQFSTYAKTVVKNGLLSYCRKVCNHRSHFSRLIIGEHGELAADGEALEPQADDFDARMSLVETLSLLEASKQEYDGVARLGIEALALKLQGMRVTDIAEIYHVPPSHVGAWISRSAAKLRCDPRFLASLL